MIVCEDYLNAVCVVVKMCWLPYGSHGREVRPGLLHALVAERRQEVN
jgi:hypothetical protein